MKTCTGAIRVGLHRLVSGDGARPRSYNCGEIHWAVWDVLEGTVANERIRQCG
jgi:hypothetical protein